MQRNVGIRDGKGKKINARAVGRTENCVEEWVKMEIDRRKGKVGGRKEG